MSSSSVTVIALQPSIACEVKQRMERALNLMQKAYAEKGAGVYVLPEYYLAHLYPDPCDTVAQAEMIPGPSTRPLMEWAANMSSFVIVGLLEKSDDPLHPYNTAALLGPAGIAGVYRKTHLWDHGPTREPYRECKLFRPGEVFGLFEIAGRKVGVMICADGVFPECPRSLVLDGAELLLYPNSRSTVGIEVEAAARANVVPIVVSNPVGSNGADHCAGTSRIVAPSGVLAAIDGDQEGWVAAELNLASITARRSMACELRQRRPDLYANLTRPE